MIIEFNENLELLKHFIEKGELTGTVMVFLLQMMIQEEPDKPEKAVNVGFIESCSLLIEIIYPSLTKRPEGYYKEQEAK